MKFYTADRVLADLDYILDNTFVTFGDQVYRQTLGVPMGFACSPMIAVLMLCYYELRGLRDIVTLAGTRGRRVDSPWGQLSLARGGRERLLDLACRASPAVPVRSMTSSLSIFRLPNVIGSSNDSTPSSLS